MYNCLIIKFYILMIVLIYFTGCGVKSSPVPPGHIPPPGVNDLASEINSNILTLSWTIPKSEENQESAVEFTIYRSRTKISDSDCKTCPVIYENMQNISINQADVTDKMVYNEILEKGYQYIYKVTSYNDDKISGKDSNIIQFTY